MLLKTGNPRRLNPATTNIIIVGNSLVESAGPTSPSDNPPPSSSLGGDQYLSYQVKTHPLLANSGYTVKSWGRGGLSWSGLGLNGFAYEDTSLQPGKVNIIIAWEGINCFYDLNKTAQQGANEAAYFATQRKNAGWDEVYVITTHDSRIGGAASNIIQRNHDYNDLLKYSHKSLNIDGTIDIMHPGSPLYMTGWTQTDYERLNPYFILTEQYPQTNPAYIHLNARAHRTIVAPLIVQKLRSIGVR